MRRHWVSLLIAVSAMAAGQGAAVGPTVWKMQESGSTAGLRGIDSVDGTVAWASGTSGTVLRTEDGGAHWTKCAVPDGDKDGGTLDFRGVQAWDAETAIVMASGVGEKSRLYKTGDGCGSWKILYKNPDQEGFWDAVSVADKDNLMLLGDPVNGEFVVAVSVDGGKTWEKSHDAGLRSEVKEGAFAASNSSLLADWVDGFVAFGSGGPLGARIFLECDTCPKSQMWIPSIESSFAKGSAAGIFGLGFRNWRHWIAVGGDYTKPNSNSGTAAWSDDAGKHWTAASKPPHGYRSAVQWSESLNAWITSGTNGSDISRDDGRTWKALDDGYWNALSLPFVVGPNGRIGRLNVGALKGR